MVRYYWLYKITSPSGKVYIGQTSNIRLRFCSYKRKDCKKQYILYQSIEKYGWENHTTEIIKEGEFTQQEIDRLEIESIKIYKDLNISLNITLGGRNNRLGITYELCKTSKPILQFDLNKNLIRRWISATELRNNGIPSNKISKACNNKTYYCKNNFWIFEKDYTNDIEFLKPSTKKYNEFPIYKLSSNNKILEEFSCIKEATGGNIAHSAISHSLCKYNSFPEKGAGFYWCRKSDYVKQERNLESINKKYGNNKKRVFIIDITDNKEYIFENSKKASEFLNLKTVISLRNNIKNKTLVHNKYKCGYNLAQLEKDKYKYLTKLVEMYTTENKFLQEFISTKEAADFMQCSRPCITAALNSNLSYKGYMWKYKIS